MKNITKISYLTACMMLSVGSAQAKGFNIGDTDVTFGGYVKLDAMYTDSSDGQIATGIGRDFYIPSLTPVGGADEGGTFDFHARQSRFFFKTSSKLENGKTIGGHIELDFMATAGGDERITNSYSPRLRQAFITYDNWLFGQAWSTFQNVGALPDSLDFIGPTPGTVFFKYCEPIPKELVRSLDRHALLEHTQKVFADNEFWKPDEEVFKRRFDNKKWIAFTLVLLYLYLKLWAWALASLWGLRNFYK